MAPDPHSNPPDFQNFEGIHGKRYNLFLSEEDSKQLDELVRVGIFRRWPNANRSTVMRALIAIASNCYDDGCQVLTSEDDYVDLLLGKAMSALPLLTLPQNAKAAKSEIPVTAESPPRTRPRRADPPEGP